MDEIRIRAKRIDHNKTTSPWPHIVYMHWFPLFELSTPFTVCPLIRITTLGPAPHRRGVCLRAVPALHYQYGF